MRLWHLTPHRASTSSPVLSLPPPAPARLPIVSPSPPVRHLLFSALSLACPPFVRTVCACSRILSIGMVWGDDDILLPDGLLKYARQDRARAMTYMEYRSVSREALHRIIQGFPITASKLRKKAIYIALARYTIAAAHKKRMEEEGDSFVKKEAKFLDRVCNAADAEAAKLSERALAVDAIVGNMATCGGGRGAGAAAQSKASAELLEQQMKEMQTQADARHAATERKLDHLTRIVEKMASASGIDVTHRRRTLHRSNSKLSSFANPDETAPVAAQRDWLMSHESSDHDPPEEEELNGNSMAAGPTSPQSVTSRTRSSRRGRPRCEGPGGGG